MGERRNPILTFVLVLLTLGIYALVWYYWTNRELNEVAGKDWNVGLFTALLVVPVVNSWSAWKMASNIHAAARKKNVKPNVSRFGHFLLLGIVFVVGIPFVQADVNKLWEPKASKARQRRVPA